MAGACERLLLFSGRVGRRRLSGDRRGKLLHHFIASRAKVGQVHRGNRLTRRLARMFAARIHEHAVPSETIVEVRTGGRPSRTDASNELTLIHVRARADALRKRRQVQVVALEAARVTDADLPSAPAGPSR